MPTLFVFLLKINVALLLFCAGYFLVLRHLTFYMLNRIYLVIAILFSSVYPKINLDAFAKRHQQLTRPVRTIVLNWQSPINTFKQPDYWHWATMAFWIGAVLLAARLLVQLWSLYKIHRKSQLTKIFEHRVRVVSGKVRPFSFWKNIYLNPEQHGAADLKSILMHEQIHVNEWHTVDVLLAELSTIFYWFNPGVWLIKKAIRENIEFITDSSILKQGVEPKQYQYSLVNVSFGTHTQGIVNHFNISTIKKRIIMMNSKRSDKINITRYVFLLPVVVLLLLVFTISKADIKNSVKAIGRLTVKFKTASFNNEKKLTHLKASFTDTIKSAKKIKSDAVYTLIGKQQKNGDTVNLILNKSIDGIIDTTKVQVKLENISLSLNDADLVKQVNVQPITMVRINGKTFKPIVGQVVGKVYVNVDTLRFDTIKNRKDIRVINGKIIPDSNFKVRFYTKNNFATVTKLNHTTGSLSYTSSPFGNSFSLNHLSDKLIVIDGKIATEADLKKLSAFDIDKMVFKTDTETKELYGEKAKNGIVFILTKKGK